jgi:AcrR family transcriptional regulator
MAASSKSAAALGHLVPVESARTRADISRQQILDVAARLFRETGYLGTSLRDLAAAVEMKAGSLYYHFKSKDELAIEVLQIGVERVAREVRMRVAALPRDANARERLTVAAEAHLEALLLASDYTSAHIRCFAQVPPTVQERLRASRRDYEQFWCRLIDRVARGPASRRRYLRLSVLGALNWSLEWFDAARDDPADFARTLTDMLLGAAAPDSKR